MAGTVPGMSAKVMRVSRFRRGSAWSAIDQELRAAMPEFLSQPGLEIAWLGRRGAALGEERIIVSVWSSAAAEAESLTFPEILRDRGADIVGLTRDVLPVAFELHVERGVPPAILRLFDGHTQPGQLEAFIEEARVATTIEAEHPLGPTAVTVSIAGADRFLTATTWTDWPNLEAFSDGDIDAPLRWRGKTRVVRGRSKHFELVY